MKNFLARQKKSPLAEENYLSSHLVKRIKKPAEHVACGRAVERRKKG